MIHREIPGILLDAAIAVGLGLVGGVLIVGAVLWLFGGLAA